MLADFVASCRRGGRRWRGEQRTNKGVGDRIFIWRSRVGNDQGKLIRTRLATPLCLHRLRSPRFSPFDEAMLASERRHCRIAFSFVAVDIALIVIADVRRKANCSRVVALFTSGDVAKQRHVGSLPRSSRSSNYTAFFCSFFFRRDRLLVLYSTFSVTFLASQQDSTSQLTSLPLCANRCATTCREGRRKSRPVRYPTRTLLRRMLINVPIPERTARFQPTMLLQKDSEQLLLVKLLRDFRLFCLTFRRNQGRNSSI